MKNLTRLLLYIVFMQKYIKQRIKERGKLASDLGIYIRAYGLKKLDQNYIKFKNSYELILQQNQGFSKAI